jgi:N-acetylglucosaminyl-diphospho-decaprenol L-rhamnosyltransferase
VPGVSPTECRLAVVIVGYNSADVIVACLAALPEALVGVACVDVVLADNASTDDTISRARAAYPAIRVVPTGGNLGYAAAINRGRDAASEHDLLLVLNPDTVLAKGSIARLATALAPSDRGLAVPRMLAPDGSLSFSLRRAPSLITALGEAVLGGPRAGRLGWGEVVVDPGRYESAGPTDWATGAVVLVARRCREAIGDWDESFFLYSEETDYMLRAMDAGLSTWYVPEAVAEHRGGESATSAQLWRLVVTNKVRLYRARHGWLKSLLYWLILLGAETARALTGKPRSRAAARALLRIYGKRRP